MEKPRRRKTAAYGIPEQKPSFLDHQGTLFVRRPATDASVPMVPPRSQLADSNPPPQKQRTHPN